MAIALNNSTLVTVFGGSGFVGRYVVQALARRGCRVRVAVRRPHLAGHVLPLGNAGQIYPVQANLRDHASVRRAIEGADAVVNLVGILQPSGKQSFASVQATGAGIIAQAVREARVGAFVQMSAIGANRLSKSAYARTKAEGEDLIRKTCSNAVILRPSIIFGPEDEFFNRFAAMAMFSPFMPLIGGGKTKFQPVYVGDVAEAIVAALDGRAKPSMTYELGGDRVYTFRELLDLTMQYSRRKRPYFPIPFWMAKIQGLSFEIASKMTLSLIAPPLTVDQVRLLETDNVVSDEAKNEHRTLEALGIERHGVEAIVPSYLVRVSPKGEYSTHHA
ncbi:MAG: complex I NDUFA9 subunit family protein [Alphaproteobacteria bacterium]